MGPFIKTMLILLSIFCFMQFVQMARLRRNDNAGNKKPTDKDVKVLSDILINKLQDSLKDCDETIKNILSCAKNSLQQTNRNPIAVAG